MAINLFDNLNLGTGKPLDARYLAADLTPYADVAAANSAIILSRRHRGLKVNVAGVDYWWKDGTANENLVAVTTGSGEPSGPVEVDLSTTRTETTVTVGNSAGDPAVLPAANLGTAQVIDIDLTGDSAGFGNLTLAGTFAQGFWDGSDPAAPYAIPNLVVAIAPGLSGSAVAGLIRDAANASPDWSRVFSAVAFGARVTLTRSEALANDATAAVARVGDGTGVFTGAITSSIVTPGQLPQAGVMAGADRKALEDLTTAAVSAGIPADEAIAKFSPVQARITTGSIITTRGLLAVPGVSLAWSASAKIDPLEAFATTLQKVSTNWVFSYAGNTATIPHTGNDPFAEDWSSPTFAGLDPITALAFFQNANLAGKIVPAEGHTFATDATAVGKTGNETIDGTKTFSSQIVGSISGSADTVRRADAVIVVEGGLSITLDATNSAPHVIWAAPGIAGPVELTIAQGQDAMGRTWRVRNLNAANSLAIQATTTGAPGDVVVVQGPATALGQNDVMEIVLGLDVLDEVTVTSTVMLGTPPVDGEQGPEGPAGSSFSVDAAEPFADRSAYNGEAEGFSFLATDTGDLYFRTAGVGTWSDPIPFRGPDGKTILNGTANPTTQGVDGDFYLRTDTWIIFGPKGTPTPGVWPAGVSLVASSETDLSVEAVTATNLTISSSTGNSVVLPLAVVPEVGFPAGLAGLMTGGEKDKLGDCVIAGVLEGTVPVLGVGGRLDNARLPSAISVTSGSFGALSVGDPGLQASFEASALTTPRDYFLPDEHGEMVLRDDTDGSIKFPGVDGTARIQGSDAGITIHWKPDIAAERVGANLDFNTTHSWGITANTLTAPRAYDLPNRSGPVALSGTTEGFAPLLNSEGEIPSSMLPTLGGTATTSKVVANAAARLALVSGDAVGFVVVDGDTGKSWMLVTDGVPATSADWIQLGDRDVVSSDITDSTAIGRALITVATPVADRYIRLGAGGMTLRTQAEFFGEIVTAGSITNAKLANPPIVLLSSDRPPNASATVTVSGITTDAAGDAVSFDPVVVPYSSLNTGRPQYVYNDDINQLELEYTGTEWTISIDLNPKSFAGSDQALLPWEVQAWNPEGAATGTISIVPGPVLAGVPGQLCYHGETLYVMNDDATEWLEIFPGRFETIGIACSDMTTVLTTGEKVAFDMPFNFSVRRVYASLAIAPTSSALTVDVEDEGDSILNAVLSIATTTNNAETSTFAAAASSYALTKGDRITIDIDAVGLTHAGLIVFLEGYRS